MTPNEARNDIYTRFLARFRDDPSDDSSDPILDRDRINFENEEFKEPMSGEWVRLVVRHQARAQITLGKNGDRKFEYSGFVFAQVFTGATQRMTMADSIARLISDIFDAVSFEGLNFQAAASRESGPSGKWNMVIVEAPFTYQERK